MNVHKLGKRNSRNYQVAIKQLEEFCNGFFNRRCHFLISILGLIDGNIKCRCKLSPPLLISFLFFAYSFWTGFDRILTGFWSDFDGQFDGVLMVVRLIGFDWKFLGWVVRKCFLIPIELSCDSESAGCRYWLIACESHRINSGRTAWLDWVHGPSWDLTIDYAWSHWLGGKSVLHKLDCLPGSQSWILFNLDRLWIWWKLNRGNRVSIGLLIGTWVVVKTRRGRTAGLEEELHVQRLVARIWWSCCGPVEQKNPLQSWSRVHCWEVADATEEASSVNSTRQFGCSVTCLDYRTLWRKVRSLRSNSQNYLRRNEFLRHHLRVRLIQVEFHTSKNIFFFVQIHAQKSVFRCERGKFWSTETCLNWQI